MKLRYRDIDIGRLQLLIVVTTYLRMRCDQIIIYSSAKTRPDNSD